MSKQYDNENILPNDIHCSIANSNNNTEMTNGDNCTNDDVEKDECSEDDDEAPGGVSETL